MNKLEFSSLCKFEQQNKLWEFKFFEYPIWIHFREHLISHSMPAERKIFLPSFSELIESTLKSLTFLLRQKQYKHVYMLMDRTELLQVYLEDNEEKKILFLNKEGPDRNYKGECIGSEFFNVFRLLFRKSVWIFFYSQYRKNWLGIRKAGVDEKLKPYLKTAMGDAFFLFFLSKILRKENKKFYSGCIVPIGEKFLNRLNSFEIQHGVIHSEHIGYIGIPKVNNKLIVYASRYRMLLEVSGYQGEILVSEFKKHWLTRNTTRQLSIVVYTQPLLQMQKEIDSYYQKFHPVGFFIQRHPKDYYPYKIPDSCFVKDTVPSEVNFPIFYNSSVIENFTQEGRVCYIINYSKKYDNLLNILNIYKEGTTAKFKVYDSLEDCCMDISTQK